MIKINTSYGSSGNSLKKQAREIRRVIVLKDNPNEKWLPAYEEHLPSKATGLRDALDQCEEDIKSFLQGTMNATTLNEKLADIIPNLRRISAEIEAFIGDHVAKPGLAENPVDGIFASVLREKMERFGEILREEELGPSP